MEKKAPADPEGIERALAAHHVEWPQRAGYALNANRPRPIRIQ